MSRSVLVMYRDCAGTSGPPGRSLRLKMIPAPGAAGCMVMVTGMPEWRPRPLYVTSFPMVC